MCTVVGSVTTSVERCGAQGTFFEPTVLTDVTTDMVITKEETFEPVAPLYRFKTEADAVKMANDAPTLTLPRSRGREGEGARLLFLQPRHRPHLARRVCATELTGGYSITSSARARRIGGTSMPSAFAAFRLMISSNLVDCMTGRSSGLVPFRMRPV